MQIFIEAIWLWFLNLNYIYITSKNSNKPPTILFNTSSLSALNDNGSSGKEYENFIICPTTKCCLPNFLCKIFILSHHFVVIALILLLLCAANVGSVADIVSASQNSSLNLENWWQIGQFQYKQGLLLSSRLLAVYQGQSSLNVLLP